MTNVYSKEDVFELARLALAENEDHTGRAANVMREIFPILGLRGAVEVVRAARAGILVKP